MIAGLAGGCTPAGDDPHAVVVATPWPPAARAAVEAAWAREADARPIRWVEVDARRLDAAPGRRGGVDLILGGTPDSFRRLADAGRLDPADPGDPAPWRRATRPDAPPAPAGDPRDDPAALAAARATLDAAGWAAGYGALVRRPVDGPPDPGPDYGPATPPRGGEAVALARGARHPDGARRLLEALARAGLVEPAPADADLAARADGLLADLLGAALVDAAPERRDAQRALDLHGHPAVAEAAAGQVPPWPPASVARLRDDPDRAALLDALVAQVAPDAEARAWLRASWDRPRRPIDPATLRAVAAAAGGKLAREPRFRAWLRAEWGAWARQLYRRVARLAGGYRPS